MILTQQTMNTKLLNIMKAVYSQATLKLVFIVRAIPA